MNFYGDGTYSSKIKMEASEVSFEQKIKHFYHNVQQNSIRAFA